MFEWEHAARLHSHEEMEAERARHTMVPVQGTVTKYRNITSNDHEYWDVGNARNDD